MTVLDTREASGGPTGASIGLYETTDATRTIADLVEDVGFLKNRTRILVADSNGVYDSAQQLHSAALDQLLRTAASQKTRESLPDLLEGLSGLGFAWRDLGRVVGVSVPALRKWRQGESAAGDNRLRVARLAAFCDIVREQYLIDDPSSWLETPIHVAAPTTGLDLETLALQRNFAKACLDWTERKHHLGGALGRAITARMLELKWLVRLPNGRALRVTETGRLGLQKTFGIRL